MKIYELTPIFLDEIPQELESGILYISELYKVAIHLCACGCGIISVTPLNNGEWVLTKNNSKVSLTPSIGNFNGENPYHAHYFITENYVKWC